MFSRLHFRAALFCAIIVPSGLSGTVSPLDGIVRWQQVMASVWFLSAAGNIGWMLFATSCCAPAHASIRTACARALPLHAYRTFFAHSRTHLACALRQRTLRTHAVTPLRASRTRLAASCDLCTSFASYCACEK
jgi:hypothetical protein